MGIDARIEFKESRIPINDLSFELGMRVGSNWFSDPIIRYIKYNEVYSVDTTQRWWGPGYERGYWPAILATLEICMVHTTGLRYYGDTCDYEDAIDLTENEIERLHTHFLTGDHTYRKHNYFAKDMKPPVDKYGHDMVCNGGGGNKTFWYSLASNEKLELTYDKE